MNPVLRIFLGFTLLWLLLDRTAAALGSLRGEAGLLVAAITLAGTLAVEALLFGRPPRKALQELGLTARPEPRGLAAAAGIALLLLAFWPIALAARGLPLAFHPDTLAILPGLFAQAGIAEETVFRGFVFRRLREGRSFGRAAFLSMIPFAAVHLLLIPSMGVPLGVASTLLALAISLPMARLFESGGGSVWGPALVHAVIQGSIKVLVIPTDALLPLAVAWMAACAVVPYLAFAWPRRARRRPVR